MGRLRWRRAGAVALSAVIAVTAIVGCSREIGTRFEQEKVRSLVPGKSTLREAIALLGPAVRSTKTLRGHRVVKWRYLRERPGETDSAVVIMKFDSSDKLVGTLLNWNTQDG